MRRYPDDAFYLTGPGRRGRCYVTKAASLFHSRHPTACAVVGVLRPPVEPAVPESQGRCSTAQATHSAGSRSQRNISSCRRYRARKPPVSPGGIASAQKPRSARDTTTSWVHRLRYSFDMSWTTHFFDRVRHEKSVVEKESVSQHVVEWGQYGSRICAWACNGSGETWNHCFLDRCACTAKTQKEKANATLTWQRAACWPCNDRANGSGSVLQPPPSGST